MCLCISIIILFVFLLESNKIYYTITIRGVSMLRKNDTKEKADYLVKKLCQLRVFTDENGKMNLSLKDVNGELLVVSQFTLYADCTQGNRPSFINAAKQDKAEELYEYFCKECREKYNLNVEKGIFGADMKVSLLNDGPVTIIMEK